MNVTIHDEYFAWLVEGMGVVREEGDWSEVHPGSYMHWKFTYEMLAPVGLGADGDEADLVGYFGDRFVLPPFTVPGQRMNVPLVIQNVGGASAKGTVAVELYASTDQFLDGSDVLLKRQERVRLNLRSGAQRQYSLRTVIPGDIESGEYYFLAKIDADNVIEESFEDNNLAVSSVSTHVVYCFGNVGGKRNVSLTLSDAYGTPITFMLRGKGYGEVERGENGHLNVTFYGTDARSSAFFRTPRRLDGVINDINIVQQVVPEDGTIGGSLRMLSGRTIDLVGDVTCGDGWLGHLLLDDVADDHTITIGENFRPVTLTFGSVGDLSIFSAAPINRMTATEWVDENETPDQIVAPWVGSLYIRGNRRNRVLGHFGADLILSGVGARGATLRNARINGDLYGAEWDITGRMGPLRVNGIVEDMIVRTTDSMGPLTMGAVVNSDFLAGISSSVARHAQSAADFVNPAARMRSVIIRGIRGPRGTPDPYYFENSNFSAGGMSAVILKNLWTDNGGEQFGFFALSKESGGGSISVIRHRDTVAFDSWTWKPADGVLDILDFTAQVL
jgi:hypothetical protein